MIFRLLNILLKHILNSIFFALIFSFQQIHSQKSEADSIFKIIENTTDIEVKVKEYLALGNLFKENNSDTAMYFYKLTIEKAEQTEASNNIKKYKANAFLKIAEIYLYKGLYDSTHNYIARAGTICKKYKLPSESAAVENMKGLVCFYQGNYTEALNYYKEAYKIASKNKDEAFMAKIYTNQAIVNYYQGNYDDAILLFKKPVEIGKKTNDKELLAGGLVNLGIIYSQLGELDSALYYFNASKIISTSIHDINGVMLCNENMTSVFYNKGEYDKALPVYFELLEYHVKNEKKLKVAMISHNIADIYMRIGEFKKSLSFFLKAATIRKELSDKKGLAQTFRGLGQLHLNQKNYDQASKYFNDAASEYKNIEYQKGVAASFMSIASIYLEEKKFSAAEKLYDSAQIIYEKAKDKIALSDLLMHKTSLYVEQKKYSQARITADNALTIKKELQDKSSMAQIYYFLSEISLNTLLYDEALRYANLGWKLAEGTNSQTILVDLAEILMKIYIKLQNNTLALEFANKLITLKDSLYNKEKTEAMILSEMRWQTKDQQEKINKLEQEQKVNQLELEKSIAESQKQKLLLIMLSGGLLLSMIVLFLIIQSYKRKRDLLFQKHMSDINKLNLQNIQNRISSHFFFNALGSAALPLNNFPKQKDLFDKLILLLRYSLINAEKLIIPLNDEIKIVDSFIGIHEIKEKGNFIYKRESNIQPGSEYYVPAMILQIPVENAIKHGLAPLKGEKKLYIFCLAGENSVNLIIKDNGIGRKNSVAQTVGTGSGLKLLMQTIHLLNKQNTRKIEFNIKDPQNEAGTLVEITIPKNYNYQIMN